MKLAACVACIELFAAISPAKQQPAPTSRTKLVSVRAYDSQGKLLRSGNGFFISKEGHVVTSRILLVGAARAEVQGGRTWAVKGVVAESVSGGLVAVLVASTPGEIEAAPLANTMPEEREMVILAINGATGTVEAVRDIPGLGRVLRISAPVPPDASGTPLLNQKGEVIAVLLWPRRAHSPGGFAATGDILQAIAAGKPRTLAEWNAVMPKNVSAQAEDDYREGIEKLLSDSYSEALACFERVIRNNPNHAEAWFHLGFAEGKLGLGKEKIEAYRRALRIKPDYAIARYSLGVSYALDGRRAEAVAEYDVLKKIDPGLARRLEALIEYATHPEHEPESLPSVRPKTSLPAAKTLRIVSISKTQPPQAPPLTS